MRFAPANPPRTGVDRRRAWAGFTLAEVLAALAFIAIVIPVAIEGIRLASLTGQVGLRKSAAARVAERVLNEWVVQGQSRSGSPSNQRGTVQEGVHEYLWSIRAEPWNQDTMRLATAEVLFTIQGREYNVRMSTLVDSSMQ